MPTNFPTSLDGTGNTLPVVATGVDNLNAGGNKSHDTKHGIEDGAIIALETKLGIGSSTPSLGTLLHGTAAGSATWLALGTAGQVPTVNAGATDVAYAAPVIVIPMATGASVAPGTAYLGGPGNTPEAQVNYPLPVALTITKMYVSAGVVAGVGQSYTYTLRKNGADTAITCAISGGSALAANDTAHSVAFTAGDLIDIKVVVSGGGATSLHTAMVST